MSTTSTDPQVVDVAFPIRGEPLPLDHGYPLFAALSRLAPAIHAESSWGVHPVFGERKGRDQLRFLPRSSVKIRLPIGELSRVMSLAGASLEIDRARVELGFPRVFPLVPAPAIRARFVTIRGFQEDEAFVAAIVRQLGQLHEDGALGQEPASVEVTLGKRRICVIHGKRVVGFALGLGALGADASLAIQRRGLGGRRHMGGGIFVPPGVRG
ncbi:MAG TPA: type I-MYXAN CRISPR-associated protein Cas6/Cmx6 [Nannocystis exedens]|nr:type I-MYXAN CRISPR-associated protein Cas6/Cmx6 [Nannocystis exedens]